MGNYQTLSPFLIYLFGNLRLDNCYQTGHTICRYLFGNYVRFDMGIIKDLLKEELDNSLRLRIDYKEELRKRPGGSIVVKEIKGRNYYYLAYRDAKKVKFIYKGKKISKADIRNLKESKNLRVKYKKLIQKLDKRIKYLKKALHGKED